MGAATAVGTDRHDERHISGRPEWLLCEPEPVYTIFHAPATEAGLDVAVLMLPPFGWDNDCSYRARREWALALARAGIAALRMDLPGTEDSVGSPRSGGRLASWLDAISDAAQSLREQSGATRVVALGIGIGGLLAYQSACLDAPIDDLILWGVRSRGRAHVRELRAYGEIVAGGIGNDAPADGTFDIGGYVLTAETAANLEAIRLTDMTLPNASLRRVLLIEADARGVDGKLQEHLEQSGVDLLVLPSSTDYDSLMALPELGLVPESTIASSIDWLSAGKSDSLPHTWRESAPATTDTIIFEHNGRRIRERLTDFETAEGRMVGIVSEPVSGERAPYCVVSVNSGALRRTGPNRMMTDVARRSAARGTPAARFDLPGLADSDGPFISRLERTAEIERERFERVRNIHDHLQATGVADRFFSVGVCSAAYFAMRAALLDERAIGGIFANMIMFEWKPEDIENELRFTPPPAHPDAGYVPALPQPPSGGEWRQGGIASTIKRIKWLWRLKNREDVGRATRVLKALRAEDKHVIFLFADGELIHRMLRLSGLLDKLAGWPQISVEVLPTVDHLLRPLWVQELVYTKIDAALSELSASHPREST